MRPADNPPICLDNGQITVDAAFLAPKLGLSVEALRAGMRVGRVVGTVEEGRDEDAGRFRVTFRYGARVWRAVVEADGRHSEVPADPADIGTPSLADLVRRATWDGSTGQHDDLKGRVRAQLRAAARRGTPVTYRDLALTLDLSPPNTIHQLTELLEALMAEDAAADRPFIAALVVSKARRGLPAPGFFDCARRLGRFDGAGDAQEAAAYHARELAAAIAHWREAGPGAEDADGR